MWTKNYEKLNNSEREEFKRLLNLVMSKTFVMRDYYDTRDSMMKINPEYRFFERHFELFSSYLAYSGWDLRKDNQYGVIGIENIYEYNRMRLDRFTTLILYVIRLVFEEERERISLRNEILTSTGQIIHRMITLNIIKKKPSDRDMSGSLRLLSNHNLIQKVSGVWEDADTKILILPSVLFVVTNEKISRIFDLLDQEEADGPEGEEEGVDDKIIRGEGDDE